MRMFWNHWKDLREAEERITRLENIVDCLRGSHEWGISNGSGTPYVRCNLCYVRPKETKA